MGCIVSSPTPQLTNMNVGMNGNSSKEELEGERLSRLAGWLADLDEVAPGEHRIVVVEAREASLGSSGSVHSESATVIDGEGTPRTLDDDDSEHGPPDAGNEAEDKFDESSIGGSEPDLSEVFTKADVRILLSDVRDQLEAKRREERAELEAGNLESQFTKFDLNDDRWISRNEFVKVCKSLGSKLDAQALTQVYYTIDINGDGILSQDEFIAAFTPLPKPKKQSEILMDPMVAAERSTPSRPISAKNIKWKRDF